MALLVVALALASGAPAAAAPSAITGKLSRPGYKVIALAATGKATSVQVERTAFSLRPPAARVTLHLRAPDGTYAGPIVVRRSGALAVLGVRAGARLSQIRIRAGHATLRARLATRWLDTSRRARARKGVPIGAGKVGLVRVKLPRRGAPGDRDLDGIPDVVDIDDDGDLILDDYDRRARFRTSGRIAQTARAASFPDGRDLDLNTMFGWTPFGAVNANGGSTDEQLAAAQRSGGVLAVFWDGLDPGSGELDCGTLVYCSEGGTGLWRQTNQPPDPSDARAGRPSFPGCCDADADGLGSLVSDQAGGGMSGGMFLLHGATSDEIRAEDILIARGTENGVAVQYPSSVGFVFSSVPVFAGYDDGQGSAASFSYPPSEACRPGSVFAGVSGQCSSPVRAGANGEVVLALTVWRPQRPRLENEAGAGKWLDVGHLAYAVFAQVGSGGGWCPQSTYTATDANLSPLAFSLNGTVPVGAAFADTSADQPANPGNTLGFTLNLTQCSAAVGAPAGTTAPVLQIWSYAIGSNYPNSGPAPDAHSQVGFRLVG